MGGAGEQETKTRCILEEVEFEFEIESESERPAFSSSETKESAGDKAVFCSFAALNLRRI